MKRKNHIKNAAHIILLTMFLSSCTGLPENIQAVDNFNTEKYLGTWYEIARLDHSFEKDLQQVSAHYQRNNNGGLTVTNKGYNPATREWKTATGKAYFIGEPDIAHLKVSFFGPFYGSYIIFELDQENYQYAFVTSYNKDFLWLLSRTKTVDEELLKHFMSTAVEKGFNTKNIQYIKQ